jgi:hypothetical protein
MTCRAALIANSRLCCLLLLLGSPVARTAHAEIPGWVLSDPFEDVGDDAAATPGPGNVTATVDGDGNLVVLGDNGDNCVWWFPTGIGEGDLHGCNGTLVNGGASAPITGATNDFRFVMRGGHDVVRIEDGDGNAAPDDLEITTGSGNDEVLVKSFHVLDDLTIKTGPGDDLVTLDPGFTVFVEDKTDVVTGPGNDVVLMRSSPSVTCFFQDDCAVRTAEGRDFVHLCGVGFRNGLLIDLGPGDDSPSAAGDRGGLCVDGNTVFDNPDAPDDVVFRGGDGTDEWAIEFVSGIAPPGVLGDYLASFEAQGDECSYLGGTPADCDTFSGRNEPALTTVTEPSAGTSSALRHHGAVPGGAEIRYGLTHPADVRIVIYDIRGRLVRRVLHERQPAGEHRAAWDGRDGHGDRVAAGIYLYRLETAGLAHTGKIVVVR